MGKILLIGASIMDVVVTPAGPEVFTEGSYPAEDIRMTFGGDALNEATVLASLGKNVYLNTILGNDRGGNLIRNHCDEKGIELVGNFQREGLQTGINIVLVTENGERNFLTNKNGSLRKLVLGDIADPFPQDVEILSFASIFVYPEMKDKEMAEIFKRAKAQGITVCADMTKRKNGETVEDIREALSYADYLMPNEEEAYLVTGVDTPERAAQILHCAGVKNVVIKCGKKGCYVLSDGEGFYVPAVPQVNCIDTTGAGDSFAGGFLYGLSEGWDVKKCAEFANQCGARAVAQIGATSWCEGKVPEPHVNVAENATEA